MRKNMLYRLVRVRTVAYGLNSAMSQRTEARFFARSPCLDRLLGRALEARHNAVVREWYPVFAPGAWIMIDPNVATALPAAYSPREMRINIRSSAKYMAQDRHRR